MTHGDVILRFDEVSFSFDPRKPLLREVDFSVRENAKLTIVGQNGAGKSTIFKLITGELRQKEGKIHLRKGATIGTAKQIMTATDEQKTVAEYFAGAFPHKKHDIDRDIARVLEIVRLHMDGNKTIKECSGGQKARLLLAYALMREPDILLLDEPTNNLDAQGIDHLTDFLMGYEKTALVISHDSGFLNSFTHGVLHLDTYRQKVDQYVGDYFDVVARIEEQIEAENRQNARMEKEMQDRKDKINFFSHKGGKMRKLASKMRDAVKEAEENKVAVRREDKTIPPFAIEATPFALPLVKMTSVHVMKDRTPVKKKVEYVLRRRQRLRIAGPNGIGKSSLLEAIVRGKEKGVQIAEGVKVGYYRQDFSGLPMDKTVYQILEDAMERPSHQDIFSTAARFLLPGDKVQAHVSALSEGQKGLLCFARFVLEKPSLLLLDEPTNHINFRHLPVIAQALDEYEGGMMVISHDEDFMGHLKIDTQLDLGAL